MLSYRRLFVLSTGRLTIPREDNAGTTIHLKQTKKYSLAYNDALKALKFYKVICPGTVKLNVCVDTET